MPDNNDLMQNVCDFFVNLYNSAQAQDPGSTFLSFQKIGSPVSPSDLQLPGQTGFSAQLATEYFSKVANFVPSLSTGTAKDTAATVEDLYEMLLLGAQPLSSAAADLQFFAGLKTAAQKKFDDLKMGALSGPFQYHPCYADPVDWYNTATAGNWVKHTFTVEKPATPPPTTGAPVAKPTGAVSAVWRVAPSPARLVSAVQKYPNIAVRVAPTVVHAFPPPTAAPQVHLPAAKVTKTAKVTASPLLMARRAPASKPEAVQPARRAAPALYRSVMLDPKINFAERASLQRALLQHAPARPVSSDKFSISFSYCVVKVQRPWFYEPFLFNKNWYIPTYKAGSFSSATAGKNNGLFPAVPIAIVVIKDLEMTANWSDADTKNAQNAMAFGPFSLASSKFENNTLSSSGMQIIAWIFNVLPLLPANDDPALSTASSSLPVTGPAASSAVAAATASGSTTASAGTATALADSPGDGGPAPTTAPSTSSGAGPSTATPSGSSSAA